MKKSSQSLLYLAVFYCTLYCDMFRLLSKAIIRPIYNTCRKNPYIKHDEIIYRILFFYCGFASQRGGRPTVQLKSHSRGNNYFTYSFWKCFTHAWWWLLIIAETCLYIMYSTIVLNTVMFDCSFSVEFLMRHWSDVFPRAADSWVWSWKYKGPELARS
jgi:hypothetical protein